MSTELATIDPPREMMPALSMQHAVERHNAVVKFTQTIMKSGIDFGVIPGTDKPTLLKPGAEKLCTFFGLAVDYVEIDKIIDFDRGLFFITYKAVLSRNGQAVATGIGSCNSHEKKYRWRWVSESDVPPTLDKKALVSRSGSIREPEFAINKAETSGKYGKPAAYWDRFKKAIADGSAKKVDMPKKDGGKMLGWEIGGAMYRIPNEDAADVLNTIQKMAQKRALVAATLVGANASEFYTQDVEDMEVIEGDWHDAPAQPPSQRRPQPAEQDPIVLGHPDDVREMKELLNTVRLPDGTIDKWFAKAGVDAWEDMPADQLVKCIEYVRNRLSSQSAAGGKDDDVDLSDDEQFVMTVAAAMEDRGFTVEQADQINAMRLEKGGYKNLTDIPNEKRAPFITKIDGGALDHLKMKTGAELADTAGKGN